MKVSLFISKSAESTVIATYAIERPCPHTLLVLQLH